MLTSPFSLLFMELQAYLQARLPTLQNIDIGYNPGKMPPATALPCVLIDIEGFSYMPIGQGVVMGSGIIALWLYTTVWDATRNTAPPQTKEAGLHFLETEQALHAAIEGWQPTDTAAFRWGRFTRISATGITPAHTHHRIRQLRYTLALEDYSTATHTLKTRPTPMVNCEW